MLGALCWFAVFCGQAADLDEDGIEDSLEQMLIDRYRPFLKYDGNERFWPSSVTWYLQHSRLFTYNNGVQFVYGQETLAADPLKLLEAACASQVNGACVGRSSSIIQYPHTVQQYGLSVHPDFETGEGPIPVGTYGHVVALTGPIVYSHRDPLPVGPNDILIQYWQFFPRSDSQAPDNPITGSYDHDGDWLYLDLYVKRAALSHTSLESNDLRFVVYHHHGDGNCYPDVLPWADSFKLTADGHPICYLDEGSHEWWPWACSDDDCHNCFGSDPHDGTGQNYLTENVINLGERYAPMPGLEPQLILFYNGLWGFGDGPEPPAFQFYPSSPLLVGFVDRGASAWTEDGLGSKYHPFLTLLQAQPKVEEAVDQFPNSGTVGRILMKPDNYSGVYEFSKPITLEAWGTGTVTIGQ